MQTTNERVGYAGQATYDSSGRAPLAADALPLDPSGAAPGVPSTSIRSYVITPLTLGAANVAASQTPTVAGALTLTAGTGVTATTITVGGVSYNVLQLDCERGVSVTGVSGTVAATVTVTGFDQFLQPVTCAFTGPAGATTTNSNKTFLYINTISVSGGTTNAVTVGTSDTFGLNYRADFFDQVTIFWNSSRITATTGFVAADSTSPTTTATGDVRGSYAVQSASDGTKRLRVVTIMDNPNNMNNAYGIVP